MEKERGGAMMNYGTILKAGLLIGLGTLLGLQCQPEPASVKGDLTAVRDQVTCALADQSTAQVVALGKHASVGTGDRIKVDEMGLARLEFPDLLMVEISRDSDLKLRGEPVQSDCPLIDLYLGAGAIFCDATPRELVKRRIVVGTEWAQIEATGTSFIVQYEPGMQTTQVVVVQGQVIVAGQGQGVIATDNQLVQVKPGEVPTWPQPEDPSRWLDALRSGRPLATSTPTTTPRPAPTSPPGLTPTRTPARKPVIHSFTANPPVINAGNSSTLSWVVTDATSVEIDHGVGSVVFSGSRSVRPAIGATTYRLTAHGPGGDVTAITTVTVKAAATINATVTYYGYDATSGWVTFRIVNAINGATLDCVEATIRGRYAVEYEIATYYGPAYSNSPFYASPTSSVGENSLAPGSTRYLHYPFTHKPTSASCQATFTLYTADNKGGLSAAKTVDFDLSGGGINATITYHSYDYASDRQVTFNIWNSETSVRLECVQVHIVDRRTNATYYGPTSSNTPFYASPTSTSTGESSLSPGAGRFLRYFLAGNPAGVPCRATFTLYTADNKGGNSVTKTVDFDLPPGPTVSPTPSINATITYNWYDAASGWVTLRIENAANGATLECVQVHIVNRETGATYYGPTFSDTPFRTTATQTSAWEPAMPAGRTRYLCYQLSGKPTGVPCRATLVLYTGDGQTGTSSVKTVDFDLPPGPTISPTPNINATIAYHSYNASTGWVTFQIVNHAGSATLERALTRIVDRHTNATYYGPTYSNSPFYASPTSSVGENSLAPGSTRYLRFPLTGNLAGASCRATFMLYTADNQGGTSATKTVDFDLPPGPTISPTPNINATITYYSYDAASGWVTLRIVNAADGARLECVQVHVVNRETNATYYGPTFSNAPFYAGPTSSRVEDSLAPGATRYLRYNIRIPIGASCRATITLYTADNRGGASATRTVNFTMPAVPSPTLTP
jgi:hypothetical protein